MGEPAVWSLVIGSLPPPYDHQDKSRTREVDGKGSSIMLEIVTTSARSKPGCASCGKFGPKRAAGLAAALCLLGFSVLISIGCESKATPTFDRPPAPVSAATAVSRDVPIYLDEIGKCVAREVVSVQPQVSGPITGIHFIDGADVKVGDSLFTIDPRPFDAELQRAEANLAKETAAARQAEANLARDLVQAKNGEVQSKRYEDLLRQEGVSKEQYDQVRTDAEALQATVNADRAALASAQQAIQVDRAAIESAKVQLGYCFIRSPINGRAGHRLVDIGNVVAANTGSLLVIQRLDPIYADFTVTENDLTSVQRNMSGGKLRVEVRLPDEDAPLAGQLTFLDNAVQQDTGTVMLRATVPNPGYRLWPGRFVRIRLVLSTLPGAVLVPAAAVQMSAKGPFMYVIKDDSTAEMRPVKTGQRHDNLIVVERGARAGERVVVNGQLAVTPGGKVHVEQEPVKMPSSLPGERIRQ